MKNTEVYILSKMSQTDNKTAVCYCDKTVLNTQSLVLNIH